MAKTTVTGDQYMRIDAKLEEIKRQLRQKRGYRFNPDALEQHLQAAVEGRFYTVQSASGLEIVKIRVLDRAELVYSVYRDLDLTYRAEEWFKYDFDPGKLGQSYEAMTWSPDWGVSSDTAREHFSTLGFQGNAAVFLEWSRQNHGDGRFLTIPEDDRCYCYYPRGELGVPHLCLNDERRELGLPDCEGEWRKGSVFVAFREVAA